MEGGKGGGGGEKGGRGEGGGGEREGSYLCTNFSLTFLKVIEGQSWWELQDSHDCHH